MLDCGNSGTTIRLMAGVLAGQPFHSVLTGDASLRTRPMARVVGPLREMGAHVDARAGGTLAPMAIRGGGLHGIRYRLAGRERADQIRDPARRPLRRRRHDGRGTGADARPYRTHARRHGRPHRARRAGGATHAWRVAHAALDAGAERHLCRRVLDGRGRRPSRRGNPPHRHRAEPDATGIIDALRGDGGGPLYRGGAHGRRRTGRRCGGTVLRSPGASPSMAT